MSVAIRAPAAAGRASERGLLAVTALLFAASAAGTAAWCGAMGDGMRMPGGWTMSMAWMRMPGQGWPAAAAAYLGMWALMMVAMMLPSLFPMLARFRRAARAVGATRLAGPTAVVAAGYFAVWTLVGAAVWLPGVLLAAAQMRWDALARTAPLEAGATLLLAGALQLTPWKQRHLGACRGAPGCCAPPRGAAAGAAWRHGVDLGLHCALCCTGLMAALLVLGVMDLRAMALVGAAITAERLAPWPRLAAGLAGLALLAAGAAVLARSLGA